jgi:hypothetical protein
MSNEPFACLEGDELEHIAGGTSPLLKQLWAAGEAKRWNQAYQSTIERSQFHGVQPWGRNSLAVQHADYITGRSRFPAQAVPYVTVGPGAVR